MAIKLVPLSAFGFYGTSQYEGPMYETVDGQIYVPLDVDEYDAREILEELVTGEIYLDSIEEGHSTEFDILLDKWVKYIKEDEEEIDEIYDKVADDKDRERIYKEIQATMERNRAKGIGYIYSQRSNTEEKEQMWHLFYHPEIHDKKALQLKGYAKDREKFLRRFHTGIWAALTVEGELSRHCEEVAEYVEAHISRLKEKFGNKFQEYVYIEDAKNEILYAKMDKFEQIKYFGEVISTIEMIADGLTAEDIFG